MGTTPTMLLTRTFLALSLLLVPTLALAGCGGGDDASSKQDTKAEASDETTTATEGDDAATPGIVLGEQIGDVRIGDDVAAVEAALGAPDRREEFDNEISGATDETLEWDEPAIEVIVAPNQPDDDPKSATMEAVQVTTTDDSLRTPEGIGVGSTRAEVDEAYPKAECDTGEIVVCRVPSTDNLTTDFFVEEDAVTRVVVGRILD